MSNATVYTGGGGCYPNLFGAHPPFQIDSNFGACAGIVEILLQNREGEILLLPALPKALANGYVKGLRAPGGVTVDISFNEGRVTEAVLTLDKHLNERNVSVRFNGGAVKIILKPGIDVSLPIRNDI
jgi:alpha-L-fucosidase 2